MIKRFILGPRADLKLLTQVLRADYSLPNAFRDYLELAGAQGEAHRALVGKTLPFKLGPGSAFPMRPRLKTTIPRHITQVCNVETEQLHCDDGVYPAPAQFIENRANCSPRR